MLIPVADVRSGDDRIRGATPDTVAALADSMRVVGLLNPITVVRSTIMRNGMVRRGFRLVAGLHRLEAAKALGWADIEAHVTELSGWHMVLAECDENLRGPSLTPAERAIFTAKRKEAYEALHPETRHGVNQHARSRQFGDSSADRFTADTAASTGQSERAVQRDATRGGHIAPEVLDRIQGTDLDKGVVLDRLAKLDTPERQAREVDIILQERAPAPVDPERTWRDTFFRVWERGAPDWRDRALASIGAKP